MLSDSWGSPEDYDTAMGRPEDAMHEPAIELTIDWPGESDRTRHQRWSEVFALLSRFAHVRQSRVTVRCEDEDGDVEVWIQYLPNRQEIAFHTGAYEFADARSHR